VTECQIRSTFLSMDYVRFRLSIHLDRALARTCKGQTVPAHLTGSISIFKESATKMH
jgi:hypothetical protein